MTVKEIFNELNALAPFSTQAAWDNSGILIGDDDTPVTGILAALDVTDYEVDLAVKHGLNLIVAHHPVIFHPLKQLRGDSLYAKLLRCGICVIAAHTNLDKAVGGVNDALCEKLGLDYRKCGADLAEGFLNVGTFGAALTAAETAALLRERLGGAVRFIDGCRPVKTAAVCSGSGGEFFRAAAALGCDALITGEASYHDFLDAAGLGLSLFTAGHFETENPVCEKLQTYLRQACPGVPVMVSDRKNAIITVN